VAITPQGEHRSVGAAASSLRRRVAYTDGDEAVKRPIVVWDTP
jgi:hypothetical protein